MRILSVDLASRRTRDLGLALLRAEDAVRVDLVCPPRVGIRDPLEPDRLADALVALAEAQDCRWIALDGPAGWKCPDNGLEHARIADHAFNAPAKVGLPGEVKPRSYTGFVSFSIAVFDALSERGYVRFRGISPRAADRTALEILPGACWSRLGLPRLPAKARCKTSGLGKHTEALTSLVSLQSAPTHDELQATIGGLAVLWLAADEIHKVDVGGRAPFPLEGTWREGFIIAPATRARPGEPRRAASGK